MKDYYALLGVAQNATPEQIRASHRKLAMQYHPDRHIGVSPEELREIEERFHQINEAYKTLSSPEKRREYDASQKYGLLESPLAVATENWEIFINGVLRKEK